MAHKNFKQFFVSFYKGTSHFLFYSRLVHKREEVLQDIADEYGEVEDLVLDQVI